MTDFDIPSPGFNVGDGVVGPPIFGTNLLGAVSWIPEPSGFDAMCRSTGPVGSFLKEQAREVQLQAKGMAPFDTGRLHDSIEITYGKWENGIYAEIGTDVYYAIFQEFGTVDHDPHPFLRPALMSVMGNYTGAGIGHSFDESSWDSAMVESEGRFEWNPGARQWEEL